MRRPRFGSSEVNLRAICPPFSKNQDTALVRSVSEGPRPKGFAHDFSRLSLIVSADRNSAEERNYFGLSAATGLLKHPLQVAANRVE